MFKLHLDNLQKSYGSNSVLKEISLNLSSQGGMIIGVVGKNGAGKSTLFKILSSIDTDYTGSFSFECDSEIKLGFLPEERSLAKLGTIHDILLLWARIQGVRSEDIDDKIDFWLERTSLLERKNDKISELSKGNQQKLQLACSLLNDPNLIIFDEPFSGLDPSNQELVIEIINQFKAQGSLILLSAHQLELVERISDKNYILTNGHLEPFNIIKGISGKELTINCYQQNLMDGLEAARIGKNTYLIRLENLTPIKKDLLLNLFCENSISVTNNTSLRDVFLKKVNMG